MAIPKCPKCENITFTLEELKIEKSNYRIYGVCCKKCGTVVGTEEFYNVGTLVKNLAKKLNVNI